MSKSADDRIRTQGVGGQDGSYLCGYLLDKGYTVHGLLRHRSSNDLAEKAFLQLVGIQPYSEARSRLTLHFGDVLDPFYILSLLKSHQIDEIYHFAAQSHVGASFQLQLYTCDVNALGTLRILQAITTLELHKQIKFYNACSSEIYGQVGAVSQQNEQTPFEPVSPYAAAKAFSYWVTRGARLTHGLFAVNGILFNHESPRRGLGFVTRKVSYGIARIHLKQAETITLGNLDSKRDWGHSRDYMEGVYAMMQHHSPDDYVLATGETRSVREFVEAAFAVIGVDIRWTGKGADERGVDSRTNKTRVEVDEKLYRSAEVPYLQGCAEKARRELGWTAKTPFQTLVREMVEKDISLLSSERNKTTSGGSRELPESKL